MAALLIPDTMVARSSGTALETVTTPLRTDTPSARRVNSQEATAPRQETTVTTTTTETEEESSPGIIGSAFGLVGAVIAFPFRVVGGVLDGLY
jgi:hypothetical protein